MSGSHAPRSLADQLRGWSDAELARLLTDRPDLASPAPQDSSQLASRAGTRSSVVRAVDQLTVLELAVLDATVALGGLTTTDQLRARVNADPEAVTEAVKTLCARALLWGAPEQLRVVSAVTEVVRTTLSGLGPSAATLLASYGPIRVTTLARDLGVTVSGDRQKDIAAIAEHLADTQAVQALLGEVDESARAILEHLERGSMEGTVENTDREVRRADATAPVDQLLTRGLVIARDHRHVAVPLEVAAALRGGSTTRARVDEVPELLTSDRSQKLVDRAAAGAAFELVRRIELLLEHWGIAPPAVLRGGGLAVRDLKAATELLHVDEATAALHVELAAAAGLLAVGSTDDLDAAWLPTDAFDVWTAGSVADRWARIASAWLETPRLVGLVGSREPGGKGRYNALAHDLERGWLPDTRRAALAQLAALPQGQVLAPGTGVASLVSRMKWLRPRRPPERSEAVARAMAEAALVGVTGLDGLSAHGRALLEADDPAHAAPAALEPMLPEPVDHVLLQADLTAVAPGPLEQELARRLAAMADVESRGGATVYRFTTASVRRAFDAGWSAAEIHEFVTGASRTPVPQPLVYLVDDVARRFGTIRAGVAEAFLRSDDETALAELVHHPKASSLRLRRIAPTVVVTDVPLDVLLPRLRELGAAPVVEAPDGTVRLARREGHRARSPRTRAGGSARTAARATARVSATVTAIRAGDEAAAHRPREATAAGSPGATLAVLREAAEAGTRVWIGYVDNHGATVERVVDPVKVEGGWLSAFDRRVEEVRSFAVHRITAVKPL
ncbi:MAG TPA: helicase C-terminal domain-containing protein [Nocardioidaceae bacterium]|nr:helicase C-terminal domain-containing protein [Nocardioidaceae bacterium]